MCNRSWKRVVKISERNNSADIHISEGGRGENAPSTGAEILLEVMEKISLCPCSPRRIPHWSTFWKQLQPWILIIHGAEQDFWLERTLEDPCFRRPFLKDCICGENSCQSSSWRTAASWKGSGEGQEGPFPVAGTSFPCSRSTKRKEQQRQRLLNWHQPLSSCATQKEKLEEWRAKLSLGKREW